MPRKKKTLSKTGKKTKPGERGPTEEELSAEVVKLLKVHFNIESTQDLVSVVNRLAQRPVDTVDDPSQSELLGKDDEESARSDAWEAYRTEVLDIIEDRLNHAPLTKKFKVEMGVDHLNMIEYNYPASPAIRDICREILLERGLHPKEKFGFHIDWSELAIRCFPNGEKVKKANGRPLAKRDFEKTFIIPLTEVYDTMIKRRSDHCSWCINPFTEKEESIMVYPYSDYFPPELFFICEICQSRFQRNVRKRNITSTTGIRFSEELFNLAQEFCYAMTNDDGQVQSDLDVPEETFFSILGLLALRQMERDLKVLIEEMESEPTLKDVKPSQMMEILESLPYWSELAQKKENLQAQAESRARKEDKGTGNASDSERDDGKKEVKGKVRAGSADDTVSADPEGGKKKRKKIPEMDMYR